MAAEGLEELAGESAVRLFFVVCGGGMQAAGTQATAISRAAREQSLFTEAVYPAQVLL